MRFRRLLTTATSVTCVDVVFSNAQLTVKVMEKFDEWYDLPTFYAQGLRQSSLRCWSKAASEWNPFLQIARIHGTLLIIKRLKQKLKIMMARHTGRLQDSLNTCGWQAVTDIAVRWSTTSTYAFCTVGSAPFDSSEITTSALPLYVTLCNAVLY